MNAKPFVVVVFFLMFLALFASGVIGNTDLTPDTPPAPAGSSGQNTFLAAPARSGSSPCDASYTVRSGDTLSQIAQTCNVQLRDLLAANPSIQDPNLIHVDQVINLSGVPASGATLSSLLFQWPPRRLLLKILRQKPQHPPWHPPLRLPRLRLPRARRSPPPYPP